MRLTTIIFVVISMFGGDSQEFGFEALSKPFSWGCRQAVDMKCPRADVSFWLYTRSTQLTPTKLDQFNLDLLKDAPFVDAPLKVIVHGYSVERDMAVNAFLRPAYFAHGEYNIISVDWSPLGRSPCYYQAALNLPTVSHCVAQFFNAVISSRRFPSVHLLGHSMGAHISYQASREIPNLPRLTAFDPANPLYDDKSRFLVKGVAQFIDVYHSNSGIKGRRSPDGHVDVYFNNEVYQPGCSCAAIFSTCSHDRSVQYYAESITSPERMVSFRCGGWKDYSQDRCPAPRPKDLVVVGELMDVNTRGNFLMFTNPNKPYLIKPAIYTNPSTFNKYKKTAGSKCKLEYDLLTMVNLVQ